MLSPKRPFRPRTVSRAVALAGLLILVIAGAGCTPEKDNKDEATPSVPPAPEWSAQQRELYFGIPVQVRFQPANPELERDVWSYLEHVDDVFNDFQQDSEVGHLNATLAGQREAQVSEEMAEVLRFSQQAYQRTDGAFDVTIAPLRDLWRKAAQEGNMPPADALRETRARCGFDKVSLEGRTVKTSVAGMRFDFGGCIKGWAVDRTVDRLRKGGARAALVQVGGETATYGLSPRKQPHVLGIQHPIEMDRIWTAVRDPGSGLSASTSGNYRAPLLIGNRVIYHIYDPRTGRPADPGILSVSVVFPSTGKNAWADAFSTSGTILGTEAFLEMVKREGGEALILSRRHNDVASGPIADPDATSIVGHSTSGWKALQSKE